MIIFTKTEKYNNNRWAIYRTPCQNTQRQTLISFQDEKLRDISLFYRSIFS